MDNLFTTPDVLLEMPKLNHGGAGTWRRQVPPPFESGGSKIKKANYWTVPERGDCIAYISDDGHSYIRGAKPAGPSSRRKPSYTR